MAQLVGRDSHLPAVPLEARAPDALRQRFARPPRWAPEVVREKRFSDRQPTDAAVLVPIVLRSEPTVLLTERTAHLSTHSGQVAFPGGKRDPEDVSAQATACARRRRKSGLLPAMWKCWAPCPSTPRARPF